MNEHYPFENTPLPYAYEALEPYIDAQTMRLHHDKHLQSYIDNLNKSLQYFPDFQNAGLERIVCAFSHPCGRNALITLRNAGGVYNHRFFFEGMSPDSRGPCGALKKDLEHCFGSIDAFLKKFTDCAFSVFGSGYLWLVSGRNCGLKMICTPNQDTPLANGFFPVMNVDVWEHAYYLKYQNRRKDYLEAWQKVINWEHAERQYLRGISCRKR